MKYRSFRESGEVCERIYFPYYSVFFIYNEDRVVCQMFIGDWFVIESIVNLNYFEAYEV